MMAMRDIDTLRGTLLQGEPMSRHTTWRVGGPAEFYYQPADIDDLALFLSQRPDNEPLTWIGLGSNLLVRDGGIPGAVIATSGMLNEIERIDETTLRVEAGVSCAKVARFCARADLVGAEFLAGIPGTMGGALAMNAGAFGGETWPLVVKVETLDSRGGRHQRSPADYQVAYRSVQGPTDEWFVAATLKLVKGDGEAAAARIRELLERRGETQPTKQANAGSVFRNPEGDYAARLIEESKLKGVCIGNACVSDKHANFIINMGDAHAADIEALIAHVAEQVEQQQGVKLQREVHIIGVAEEGSHD